MSGVFLRPAKPTDAGKLGAMITDAVQARDWKPVLWTAAQDVAHAGMLIDRGWVTVAEDAEHRVLGFLAREGEMVHSLFVTQAAQGHGVGLALLNHAKASNARLELWTFVANHGARRFYKREGFVEVERTDGSTNDERLPDIRFEWHALGVKSPAAGPVLNTQPHHSEEVPQ